VIGGAHSCANRAKPQRGSGISIQGVQFRCHSASVPAPRVRTSTLSAKLVQHVPTGEVSERFKEHAWKACVGEILPWVRIPPSPPYLKMYGPETSFTERSEDMVYTLGPKGLFKGCRVFSSRSM
jgi:hypothetical protein